MNEENTQVPETMVNVPSEEYVLEDGEEAVQETYSVVTVDDLQSVTADIVHADLFGAFLICGTLIGLALFRRIYGT